MVCKKNPHKCISNFGALFFSSELFDCFPCSKHFHNFFFQTTKIKGYSFRRQVSRRNRHCGRGKDRESGRGIVH